MKILINVLAPKLLGGVANHYSGLKDYWTENVRYNIIGKRTPNKGSGIFWLPYDIIKFILKLLIFRPDIILLNPSLGHSPLKRDFIFLNIAKNLGFNVAIMIHGFDWKYAESANKTWIVRNLNKTSFILVLANTFKSELKKWGVIRPIYLTTTKVNDEMVKNYFPEASRTGEVKNILFLSRVEKAKGIFIAVNCYKILKQKYNRLRLYISGDGTELSNLKQYVLDNNIQDVTFTGRLNGDDITEAYKNADLFIFPTSYGEGMPTAVLEAMAFGLPIFTRNVGGLSDFFENGKMGYITDSLAPEDFAKAIENYILDANLTKKVSDYNAKYARSHFMASQVAKNIEKYCKSIYNK